MPNLPLIKLEAAAAEPVTDLYTRAFGDYPLFVHFIPDPAVRRKRLRHLFRFLVECGLRWGEIYAPSPQLEAASLWLYDTGKDLGWGEFFQAGFLKLLAGAGLPAVVRMWLFNEYANGLHRRHAPDPHYYLQLFVVDPGRQRRGFGGRFLEANLERLRAAHTPCYLETEHPENVPFYERHGFRVMDATSMPGHPGLKIWPMLWKPGPAKA